MPITYDKMMKILVRTNKSLSSPFVSVHLEIEEIKNTNGEIRGHLVLELDQKYSVDGSSTVTVALGQNSTYLLGFLCYCEKTIGIKQRSPTHFPIKLFIDWSIFSEVLPGETSMLSLVRKQADRLHSSLYKVLPRSLSALSPKLIETTMNKDDSNFVWLNTVRRPVVKNGDLTVRKKTKATHKKPPQSAR